MREIRTYGLKRGLPHWTIQGGMPYSTDPCSECLSPIKGNYEPRAEFVCLEIKGACAMKPEGEGKAEDGMVQGMSGEAAR